MGGFSKIEEYIDKLYFSEYRNHVFRQIKLNEIKFLIDGMRLCYNIVFCYQNGQYGGNYDTFYDYMIKFFTKLKPFIHLIIFKSDNTIYKHKKSNYYCYTKELNHSSIDLDNFKSNPGLFNRPIIIQAIKDLNIPYLETNDLQYLAFYANGFNSTKSLLTVFSVNGFFNVYDLKMGCFSWSYGMDLIKNFNQFDENTSLPIFYLSDFLDFVKLKHESWIYFYIFKGNESEIQRKLEYKRPNEEYKFILNSMRELKIIDLNYNFSDLYYGDLEKIDQMVKNFKFEATNYTFETNEFDEYSRFIEGLKRSKQKLMPRLIEDNGEPSVFKTKSVYLIFDEIFDILFEKEETVNLIFRGKNFNLVEKKILTKKLRCKNISDLLKSNYAPENIRALLASFCLLEKENGKVNEHLINGIIVNMMAIHLKKDRVLDIYSSNENYADINKNLVYKYDEILNKIDDADFNYETIKLVHSINKFQAIYYIMNVLNKLINPSNNSITLNLVLNGFFVAMYLSDFGIRYEIDKIISENKFLFEWKNHLFTLLSNVKKHYNSF